MGNDRIYRVDKDTPDVCVETDNVGTVTEELADQKVRESVEFLKKQLPGLHVAAIPTKSEVYVMSGRNARALSDAIIAVCEAAGFPVEDKHG